MANVLLIQPHRDIRIKSSEKYATPTTLLCLATHIKDKHKTIVLDRNIRPEDEDCINLIKENKIDIVGFTAMTSSMLLDIVHLGNLIKKEFPGIIIVVGGVHPTIEPDSVLNEPYVDYIIRGEGEEPFLEFCDGFDKKSKNLGKIKNINKNPLRPLMDVNKLKFPDYSLVDLRDYGQIFISTSRGCPGACTFCYNIEMWGKEGHPCVRFFDTEKTKQLFAEAIEKYGIREFTIADENFTTFKKRCIEVCDFLHERYKGMIDFFVFARADFIDGEIIEALKKAGCNTIQTGAESGSQRVLDFLNKKIKVEKQGEAIKILRRHKVFSDTSFMVGIPTETPEELRMTERFIRKYNPDIADVKVFNPMPGTKIFDDLVKEGRIEKPKTLKEWAEWTGNWYILKHNFSEIPDKLLWRTAKRFFNYHYYRTRFKKSVYWIKRGKVKHVLGKFRHIIRKYSLFWSWK